MIQASQIPFKVKTSIYEIIASGIVHITEPELRFEIANLTIIYRFISDTDGAKFSADVANGQLIIKLHNFSNSLGEGKLQPVEIGTLGNKKLFATWYVNTIENNLRQFAYTFMLLEA